MWIGIVNNYCSTPCSSLLLRARFCWHMTPLGVRAFFFHLELNSALRLLLLNSFEHLNFYVITSLHWFLLQFIFHSIVFVLSSVKWVTLLAETEEVDGSLDLRAPIGCSTMSRGGSITRGGGSRSPDRASSPLPLPEVVRYNTTPRGIVTIRRQESDIILPPRSLSRTNNNQLFYS